jgi:hypothetical protein
MMDDISRLDGNAAGGALARFFAFDATRMIISCGGCAAESPLGALHLYGGKMGIILRCTKCGSINLRAVQIGGAFTLDARGATRMTHQAEPCS